MCDVVHGNGRYVIVAPCESRFRFDVRNFDIHIDALERVSLRVIRIL
jgi:hypothetical protein